MEAPTSELETFSSILLQEYIRLMTAAEYIKHENNISAAKFQMSKENYERMMEYPLQTALIGLSLNFADDVLSVVPSAEFMLQYDNAIMKEVVLLFDTNYKNRYAKYIKIIDAQN